MTHEETIDWHRRLLAAWLKLANGGKGLRVGDAALIKGWKALTIESGEEAHWGDESKRHFEDLKNLYECVFEVEALEGWELREVEGEGGKSWKLVPESDDADAAGAAWERLKVRGACKGWNRGIKDGDLLTGIGSTGVHQVAEG